MILLRRPATLFIAITIILIQIVFITESLGQIVPEFQIAERLVSINSGPKNLEVKSINSRNNIGSKIVEKTFTAVIEEPNAPWLQLHFEDFELGNNSYIRIVSKEDGYYQVLDNNSIKQWNKTSAFFNGDEIVLELYVSPTDKNVFINTKKISFGVNDKIRNKYKSSAKISSCTTCGYGSTDERVSSNDPRVGRTINSTSGSGTSSTGWTLSNGVLITASHAVDFLNYIEFNVPSSNQDGTYNHPSPSDQYAVIQSSIETGNSIGGDDWAIFEVYPNSNTGLLPAQSQNSFFRGTKDRNPSSLRATGFGADFDDFSACILNEDNKTQQTDIGPVSGSESISGNYASWTVLLDVQGGASGGPVMDPSSEYAVGIISSCSTVSENMGATSTENNNFETALNSYFNNNTTHADADHTEKYYSDGSIFRPYGSFSSAVSSASNNGLIILTHSYFDEALTISKPLKIIAPVGKVVIGEDGIFYKLKPTYSNNKITDNLVENFELKQNYPNPFNPITTISYSIPERSFVTLKVFNILGQEIAVLVNTNLTSGNYTNDFDASELPSGVYIYQLKMNNTVLEKSMTLIK